VTSSKLLVSFARAGGRPPADDEAVAVREDGSFEAHRTLGGRRIGRFAGTLPSATLQALRREVAAVAEAASLDIPTPRDGATEVVTIGRKDRARFGSNERPPKPWAALVKRLRDVLRDDVVEDPVAALEAVDLGPAGVGLRHLGTEELGVDLSRGSFRATRLDARQVPVAQATGPLVAAGTSAGGGSGWQTVGPGWSVELPLGDAGAPAADTSLQVLVFLTIRDGDAIRPARLVAVRAAGSEGP